MRPVQRVFVSQQKWPCGARQFLRKEGEYIIRRLILVLEMVVSFSTITFILARVVPSEARTA
jgi:hypothetical protein